MIQIRDGAGHPQQAVMGARREVHSANGHLQRALAAFVKRAERAELRRWNLRVIEPAAALGFASLLDALLYLGRSLPIGLAAQFFIRRRGTSICKSMRSSNGPLTLAK